MERDLMQEIKKEDILLEFIYSPIKNRQNMISPIQIMKGMFLLGKEMNLQNFYEFKPYLYGPCSFEIYSDLSKLENKGLIDSIPTPKGWNYYIITEKGKEIARELEKRLDKDLIEKILQIKEIVLSKGFLELLEFVYTKYPKYAVNSIINMEGFKKWPSS